MQNENGQNGYPPEKKISFLSTRQGKIVVVIIALLAGACAGLTAFLIAGSGRPPRQSSGAEVAEATPTPTTAPTATPAPSPTPEADEPAEAGEEDLPGQRTMSAEELSAEAFGAYYRFLLAHKRQTISPLEETGAALASLQAGAQRDNIAFCDITGDGVPEMLYTEVAEVPDQPRVFEDVLRVVTCRDKEVQTLIGDNPDLSWGRAPDIGLFNDAGGTSFSIRGEVDSGLETVVFTQKDQPGICVCQGWGTDGFPPVSYHIYRWNEETGQMTVDFYKGWHGPDGMSNSAKMVGGSQAEEIDIAEYDAVRAKLAANIDKVLLAYAFPGPYSNLANEAIPREAEGTMTYDEALSLLQEQLPEDEVNEGVEDMPAEFAGSYVFTSGAGGWGSTITLRGDGSFTGEYSDYDMGVTGPGYPHGSVAVSRFHGTFTAFRRIDDHVWSAELSNVETEKTPGEEWIEDETRYTAGPAVGLEPGRDMLFLAPGAAPKHLTHTMKTWIYNFDDTVPVGNHLICNCETEEVFVGE